MATMLENYMLVRVTLEGKLVSRTLNFEEIWQYQELLYRIAVLETCSMFSQIAPVGADRQMLCTHYQMLDAYIQSLILERKFGIHDKEVKKRCDTARSNLELVVQDYRKRFGSYAPTSGEQYKADISKTISSVLVAWVQYRDTFVELRRFTNEQ